MDSVEQHHKTFGHCGCKWEVEPEMIGTKDDAPLIVKRMVQEQPAVVPILTCKECGEEVKDDGESIRRSG